MMRMFFIDINKNPFPNSTAHCFALLAGCELFALLEVKRIST